MRVIAGKARTMPLKSLPGIQTRPTQDRIKETLFNVLQQDIPNSIFIDLFSGSGGIGIEALSRGAKRAYFVEKSNKACAVINDNLKFTKLDKEAIVIQKDALTALRTISEEAVDVIYIDPPYSEGFEIELVEGLSKASYVNKDTIVVFEAALDTEFDFIKDTDFEVVKTKIYKSNKHIFLQRKDVI